MTKKNSVEKKSNWKVSRYLTKVDIPVVNTLLLYGGIDGRLVEIPQDFRASADGILDNPNAMLTETDEEIRQLMKDQGILVPEELSEKDFLFERNQLARNNTSTSLSLTICPTINCNFRCTYCYQHHIPTIMSEEVQDTLLDWIEKKHPSAKNIHINGFGGEH